MSQSFMLVSKEHMFKVKRLYKIIFQLHKSLSPELKSIGDAYVRNEFKLHKNATPEHASKFISEWTNYAKTLAKQLNPKFKTGSLGAQLEEEKLDDFSDEQIQQLYELFVEIKKINPTSDNKTDTKQT